jgi:hypothetical protein
MNCGRAGRLLLMFQLTVPSGSIRMVVGAAACSDRPRSRLTNQRHISEDEVAVLCEAICRDLGSSGFSFNSSASDDVRDQQRMCEMTNRELIGAILKSPIDMLVSGLVVALSE